MAKILKCPGCDREIRTGKTRDLNKHMNLNGNLCKGQCQPALRIMQNVGNVTPEQNTPQTENVTPEQNLPSTPEGDLISFDENPPTLQPREATNGFEFYDGKRKWYGVKEDFCALHNKYHFIKANNGETIMEAYKRINDESEAIAKKTNGRIDMQTTLAPQKSEKISEQESAWIDLATTGALIFAERYEGEANQYDVNSMYIFEMIKKDASWPIAPGKFHTINSFFTEKWSKFPYGIYKATIEGNPPKKSLQCTRYLRYNPHGIYTHYDLECARKNGLKVTLMNISPNALIYERNVHITGKDMFGEWGNILYKIKKEGGIEGKVSKALLVSLWGALCEQRNGQNYGLHPRIKPFLLASARKRISEIVKPLGDQVKRIHTDGFIIAGKVELKTGIEMGELKFEKNGVCVVKNCISITWKPSYPEIPNLIIFKENELRSTNSLPDFEKIQQDKKQNTILDTEYPASQTVKRKLSKKSDINLPNEIIIEIFQHLRTQNKRLCGNNELLFPVLYVNKRWNECATYLIWRRIKLYRYNIRNFVKIIKKKPLPNAIKYIKQIEFERIDNYFNMNEFLLEDIASICQYIITISFKDCGWGFLNNSSLKITSDTCKNLNHIFIYGSIRIAPKTVLSIPEKCTKVDSRNEDDIASQIIEDIFDED
ncbi:10738_t:CDS:2 [Entrophospora sp. SA101]|nr:10738_t:CDS:2 [Entrophospora sp. SA101]